MSDPILEALVERTRGLQPWRKLFHAFNGVLVATVILAFGLTKSTASTILAGVVGALLLVDGLRLLHRPCNALFFRLFRRLASPREARRIASSTWYAAGMALAVALFPLADAVSGILVLALADPIASYVGQRWGHRPFLGGTVAGTATFLVVSGAILASRHPMGVAAVATAGATYAERRSWPLDDNFTIPIVTAAMTATLSLWSG